MENKKIVEYRGIEGLVGAILEEDTKEGLTYGTPFYIAGTSELSKETETASDTHYYDNRLCHGGHRRKKDLCLET